MRPYFSDPENNFLTRVILLTRFSPNARVQSEAGLLLCAFGVHEHRNLGVFASFYTHLRFLQTMTALTTSNDLDVQYSTLQFILEICQQGARGSECEDSG